MDTDERINQIASAISNRSPGLGATSMRRRHPGHGDNQTAHGFERLNLVRDRIDDDDHRRRQDRSASGPDPSPEQHAKEHDEGVHVLGFAEEWRR